MMLGFMLLLFSGCGESGVEINTQNLSEMALKGKTLFEAKNCDACHKMSMSRDRSIPDLSHPLLANDSSMVETHLKFVESSEMPPIELNDDEIRALSAYISELHAATQKPIPADQIDSSCPVCNAPVSTALAEKEGLTATLFEETYYFECIECRGAFRYVPEAFGAPMTKME
jgi:mono/diheme cytochrome c family protein